MVTYPNRPDKGRPGGGDRNNVFIDNSRTRNETYITKVNVNRRNLGLNRPATLPSNNRNWDTRKWGGNKSVWGNRVNIQNNYNIRIDNNFRRSNNYAYRPNYWGARPWWGAGQCHSWHHGHWQYGWNNSYYRRHWYYKDNNDFAQGFMWGITAWSLGNLVYNMGYKTYTNPYPAPPVQTSVSTAPITYTQPVSAAAAELAPGDDAEAELAETKSDEALARSRAAFQQGDYLAASKAVDEAIGHTPGDVTLHEYRALVFFALGKYSDAAGVLNPVLASGPGWGWDTMIALYNSSDTYAEQLRRLEEWVNGSPESADARFLLGYHYMVCGHMEQAYEQFSKASELQPADSISRQLRDLTGSSIPDGGAADDVEAPERPEPVPAEALAGTWTSDNGAGGKITFRMEDAGDFLWVYEADGRTSEMKGTYGLDDKGLLILTTDDTQMVSAVEIKDGKLVFTLVGAPDGDSGLIFAKK
jgi:tetratricopeptide (TPR) repeat protein